MPSPKRWSPISQLINSDPEVWEFTDKFSDRALRTLIEVMIVLDRGDNFLKTSSQWLAGLSRTTRQKSASIQRQVDWMVAKGWLVVSETLPDGSPAAYSARNYWKYHKRQEPKGAKQESDAGSVSGPSLPYPNHPLPSSSEGRAVNPVNSGERYDGRKAVSREENSGFESTGSVIEEFRKRGGLQ